jgi:hypothetical protein
MIGRARRISTPYTLGGEISEEKTNFESEIVKPWVDPLGIVRFET